MKKALKIVGIVVAVLIVLVLLMPSSEPKNSEEAVAPVEDSNETTEKVEEKEDVDEIVKEEDKEKIEKQETEESTLFMDIIPNQTYCSDQGELVLYLNIDWDKEYDDYGLDISGFGYENEKLNDFLTITAHMIPDQETESCYNSEDGSIFMMITEDYISVVADSVEGSDTAFSGDFYLVTDDNSNGNNDVIGLTYEESVDFFRDRNNIGKEFECILRYGDKSTFETVIHHYLYLNYEYDNGNEVSLSFKGVAKDNDPIFFSNEHVLIRGTYLGEDRGILNIDIINMEPVTE